MSTTTSLLKPEVFKVKLQRVFRDMRQWGIDAWLILSRDGSKDLVASDFGLEGVFARTAVLIDKDGGIDAVCWVQDEESLRLKGFYHNVYSYDDEGVTPRLRTLLDRIAPKKIAVNTSEDYGIADGLSSGLKEYLVANLDVHGQRFVSAEDLIVSFRGRLVPQEVEAVKKSIAKCEEVFQMAQEDLIRVGRKDYEIHEGMKKIVRDLRIDLAWGAESCPCVLIGANPTGHVGYHNDVLENGDFLRIDFGVNVDGYCSDLQRVYCVGSRSASAEMKKVFDTAVKANEAGITSIRPGVKGHIVDKAARDVVIGTGYTDYKHGTGHAIGRLVHEIGPRLAPLWQREYGKAAERELQQGMVFSMEPAVKGPFGTCNLEQDVLVTENGSLSLSARQSEIICLD